MRDPQKAVQVSGAKPQYHQTSEAAEVAIFEELLQPDEAVLSFELQEPGGI
jgi:hypothetical protein